MTTESRPFGEARPLPLKATSHESTGLLSREDGKITGGPVSPPRDRTGTLLKDSTPFTNIYNVKGDNFEVFSRQETFISEPVFKCPACFKKKEKYFCPNCIRNGDFTHSKTNILERFADKKLKLIRLNGQIMEANTIVENHRRNDALKDELNYQIRETDKILNRLKRVITEKKTYLKDLNSVLNDTKRNSLKCHQKHIHLKTRIGDVKNLVAKQSVALNDQARKKGNIESLVQLLVRQKLTTLTTCIYNLSEDTLLPGALGMEDSFTASDKSDTSFGGSESTPLLTFSSDSPNSSLTKGSGGAVASVPVIRYRLVEPWIAANESFTSFFLQSGRMEYHELRENNFRNDEYRITAVLSYLCHLTNLIAIFCDIQVPRRLLFSEFYCKEFKKEDFLSKIAKLNTNILFLCLYHRIDPALLRPKAPFANLRLILNSPHFVGVLDNFTEISPAFYRTMQEQLMGDLTLTDKEEYEQTVGEQVDEHDYDFVESNIPEIDLNFATNEQSTGANIMSLVSSFYKRTTGQK